MQKQGKLHCLSSSCFDVPHIEQRCSSILSDSIDHWWSTRWRDIKCIVAIVVVFCSGYHSNNSRAFLRRSKHFLYCHLSIWCGDVVQAMNLTSYALKKCTLLNVPPSLKSARAACDVLEQVIHHSGILGVYVKARWQLPVREHSVRSAGVF